MIKLYQNLTKRLSDLTAEKHFDKDKLEQLQCKYLDVVYNVYQSERSRTSDLPFSLGSIFNQTGRRLPFEMAHFAAPCIAKDRQDRFVSEFVYFCVSLPLVRVQQAVEGRVKNAG